MPKRRRKPSVYQKPKNYWKKLRKNDDNDDNNLTTPSSALVEVQTDVSHDTDETTLEYIKTNTSHNTDETTLEYIETDTSHDTTDPMLEYVHTSCDIHVEDTELEFNTTEQVDNIQDHSYAIPDEVCPVLDSTFLPQDDDIHSSTTSCMETQTDYPIQPELKCCMETLTDHPIQPDVQYMIVPCNCKTSLFETFVKSVKSHVTTPYLVNTTVSEIQILELYQHSNKNMSIKQSVVIDQNFCAKLYVHRKEVPHNHDVWDGLPKRYDSWSSVDKLLTRLSFYSVCAGNPDIEYQDITPVGSGISDGFTNLIRAYREGDFGACTGILTYTSTIRSVHCPLLVKGNRCKYCIDDRHILRKRHKRAEERKKSPRSVDYVHSNFQHKHMTKENMLVKIKQQNTELKTMSSEIKKLKRKCHKQIIQEGVSLDVVQDVELTDLIEKDACSYCTDSEEEMNVDVTLEDTMVTCLVSKIMQLTNMSSPKKCRHCHGDIEAEYKLQGTGLKIKWVCGNKHEAISWNSQRNKKRVPTADFVPSSNIVTPSNNFGKDSSEVKTFHQCLVCDEIFEQYSELQTHNKTHIKTEQTDDVPEHDQQKIHENTCVRTEQTDDVPQYDQPKIHEKSWINTEQTDDVPLHYQPKTHDKTYMHTEQTNDVPLHYQHKIHKKSWVNTEQIDDVPQHDQPKTHDKTYMHTDETNVSRHFEHMIHDKTSCMNTEQSDDVSQQKIHDKTSVKIELTDDAPEHDSEQIQTKTYIKQEPIDEVPEEEIKVTFA